MNENARYKSNELECTIYNFSDLCTVASGVHFTAFQI